MTEKQNSVKTCTGYLKKEHLQYMEIVVALSKKGKVDDIKQVWTG